MQRLQNADFVRVKNCFNIFNFNDFAKIAFNQNDSDTIKSDTIKRLKLVTLIIISTPIMIIKMQLKITVILINDSPNHFPSLR